MTGSQSQSHGINMKIPREWVFKKFRELGLDTYMQNYTVKYPLEITRGQTVQGQNVNAILQARSSSTESIVMSSPLRPKDSQLTSTTGGIVLMMALAKHFRKYTDTSTLCIGSPQGGYSTEWESDFFQCVITSENFVGFKCSRETMIDLVHKSVTLFFLVSA